MNPPTPRSIKDRGGFSWSNKATHAYLQRWLRNSRHANSTATVLHTYTALTILASDAAARHAAAGTPPTESFDATIDDIKDKASHGWRTIQRALEALEESGVIHRERKGPTFTYRYTLLRSPDQKDPPKTTCHNGMSEMPLTTSAVVGGAPVQKNKEKIGANKETAGVPEVSGIINAFVEQQEKGEKKAGAPGFASAGNNGAPLSSAELIHFERRLAQLKVEREQICNQYDDHRWPEDADPVDRARYKALGKQIRECEGKLGQP